MSSHTLFRFDRRAALAGLAGLCAMTLPGLAAAASPYPSRPISLLVPFGPGGIADITARAVAEAMGRTLGQTIVVDNRPSAGSIVASQAVANARPDGHTVLLMSNGNAVSVGLFRKLPYDTQKDLVPVSTLGYFDLGVFVAANSRFKSLQEVVAFAKANPGRLNVGTIAVGSTQHLSAKLFETVAGVRMLLVPYKGSPAVLTALRAGEIDVAFEIIGPMLPHVQAGVVKTLAVTGDRRNPALPQAPTVIESGVPGYNVASWNALAVPAGTPADVIEVLNRAAREAVASPGVKDKLGQLGMRVAASTPAEASELLAREIKRWGEVMRAAGIEPQ
jgi:tripartite-type tricarboxylate transporter receptor subunit TctC